MHVVKYMHLLLSVDYLKFLSYNYNEKYKNILIQNFILLNRGQKITMFISAEVARETALNQFNKSNIDLAIEQINRDIVVAANKGLTEIKTYVGGCYHILTEHERSKISVELKAKGYSCRWSECGKPTCRLYISWRNA